MQGIPTVDTLMASEYVFNQRQEDIIQDISSRVNPTINSLPLFTDSGDEAVMHARLVSLHVARYLVDKYSRGEGQDAGEMFVIPIFCESETMFLLTRMSRTIVNIVYITIMQNLCSNGIFTEYWTGPSRNVALSVAGPFDVFIHTELTFDEYQDVLDRSFQSASAETQERLYGEHHHHKLHFTDDEPVERTEENKECDLCCEKSDYICCNCKYPLCSNCIRRLGKSTNQCPSCRELPMRMRRIKDGDFSIETEPNESTDDEDDAEEESCEDNCNDDCECNSDEDNCDDNSDDNYDDGDEEHTPSNMENMYDEIDGNGFIGPDDEESNAINTNNKSETSTNHNNSSNDSSDSEVIDIIDKLES